MSLTGGDEGNITNRAGEDSFSLLPACLFGAPPSLIFAVHVPGIQNLNTGIKTLYGKLSVRI